jgi:hypothetical protein
MDLVLSVAVLATAFWLCLPVGFFSRPRRRIVVRARRRLACLLKVPVVSGFCADAETEPMADGAGLNRRGLFPRALPGSGSSGEHRMTGVVRPCHSRKARRFWVRVPRPRTLPLCQSGGRRNERFDLADGGWLNG